LSDCAIQLSSVRGRQLAPVGTGEFAGKQEAGGIMSLIGAVARLATLAGVLAGGTATAQPAPSADTWPDKPVKIIVNFAPGGAADNSMRPFTEPLQRKFGQPFVIENRGGASGAIGIEAGAKATPNGYNFFVTPGLSVAILPHVRKTPYDPFKDMVPVTYFTWYPMLLSIHPAVQINTLKELVVYSKANPDKLSLGSSGIASTGHLLAEALNRAAGITILHVPYRGSADALNDFLAGTVQLFADPTVAPHIKAGKARLLAVTGTRHPDHPNVPSLGEDYPDVDFIGWNALFAPAGTPDAIVRKFALAMNEIARTPEVTAMLLNFGLFPKEGSPDDLAAILRRDYERYGQLIRDLNIRVD